MSAGSSVHTIRWANGLAKRGCDIVLISAQDPLEDLDRRVVFEKLPHSAPFGYFTNRRVLGKLMNRYRPDILNVHFASGYGTLARLVGFHPCFLSVWGSDVYDFPRKSSIHRRLVARNIRAADMVGSTSRCMLKTTNALYSHPKTVVTPFGIDEKLFSPKPRLDSGEFVFGTVKVLADKYGIDTLIDAFGILKKKHPGRKMKLEITGDGPARSALEAQAESLGISADVQFHGRVNHQNVPDKLRRLDAYVALSRLDSESFGVAILEASASGLPVIVSDVEGLMEVTQNERTGLIVPKESPERASSAMERLMLNRDLCRELGDNGREHVVENYTWDASLDSMIRSYKSLIAGDA